MIRVAVGILKRGNTVLVAERPPYKPYSGYWEFPGGKIEPNESGLAALKRELHEELGVDIIFADLLFEHQHTYPDKTVLLELWLVNDFTGEPHGKEEQALRWITTDEIHQLRLLEGNWAILERISLMLV